MLVPLSRLRRGRNRDGDALAEVGEVGRRVERRARAETRRDSSRGERSRRRFRPRRRRCRRAASPMPSGVPGSASSRRRRPARRRSSSRARARRAASSVCAGSCATMAGSGEPLRDARAFARHRPRATSSPSEASRARAASAGTASCPSRTTSIVPARPPALKSRWSVPAWPLKSPFPVTMTCWPESVAVPFSATCSTLLRHGLRRSLAHGLRRTEVRLGRVLLRAAARRQRQHDEDEQRSAHQYFRSSGSYFVTRTGLVESSTPSPSQRVIECFMKFSSSRVG